MRAILIACLMAAPALAVQPIQYIEGANSTLIMRDGDPGSNDPVAFRGILPSDAIQNRNLLTVTNTQDIAAEVDDYANEAHIGLLAQRDSATASDNTHRRYIKFGSEFGGAGSGRQYDWYTGANAAHVWILYDALATTHRLWFPTGGDTEIRAATGANRVILNRSEGGTDGLAVYNGASDILFAVDGDGEATIGGSSIANVGLTIADKSTAIRAYNSSGVSLTMGRDGGTVGNNQALATINFRGIDDAEDTGAQIIAYADAAWADGDTPGRLTFSTTPDGSDSLVEAMTIDSDQSVTLAGDLLGPVADFRNGDPGSSDPAEIRAILPIDAAANRSLFTVTNSQNVAAVVDDYANEAHIGLFTQRDASGSTSTAHRRYIKFGTEFGGAGVSRAYDWYLGANAAHTFICYDNEDTTHRLSFPTAGDSEIRSGSGATKIAINRSGGGTGGFEVYDGGTDSVFSVEADGDCAINGGTTANVGLTITGKSTAVRAFNGTGSYIYFGRSGGTVNSGHTLGGIYFRGIDDAEDTGATIVAQAESSWADDDTPARVVISTTPDGTDDPTEAVRIEQDGDLVLTRGNLLLTEKSADPSNPAEGESVLWQSDGTGTGDDGDILIKVTAGGVTKTATLVDFSALP